MFFPSSLSLPPSLFISTRTHVSWRLCSIEKSTHTHKKHTHSVFHSLSPPATPPRGPFLHSFRTVLCFVGGLNLPNYHLFIIACVVASGRGTDTRTLLPLVPNWRVWFRRIFWGVSLGRPACYLFLLLALLVCWIKKKSWRRIAKPKRNFSSAGPSYYYYYYYFPNA